MAILGLELSAKLLEADLRNWPTFALAGGALAAIVVSGVLAQYALVLLLRLYPIHRDVGEPPDS